MTKIARICFAAMFLVFVSACSNEQQAVADLDDCYNHYKAESYRVAAEACQLAADQQQPQAKWLLAQIYRFGLTKPGKDPDKAFAYYLSAATQGHHQAMREVGIAYQNGYAVDVDFALAYQWLFKAAKQQDSIAAFSLGYMYLQGQGRDKDVGSAIHWFMKAAASQHAMSINNLAWIYATSIEPAYFSPKKAKFWLNKMNSQLFEIPMFLDTKAAVLAAQGELVEAIEVQNLAISLLSDETPESELLEYQKHLDKFIQGEAWKE